MIENAFYGLGVQGNFKLHDLGNFLLESGEHRLDAKGDASGLGIVAGAVT